MKIRKKHCNLAPRLRLGAHCREALPRIQRPQTSSWWIGALFLLLCGCGDRLPPNPTVYPARGTIYLDGEPVRYGRVYLIPIDASTGAHCWGNIGADGTYVLRTAGEDDGAAPGDYRVYVEPYSPALNGPITGRASRISVRYQDPIKSELTLTVTDDVSELPPLQLKR